MTENERSAVAEATDNYCQHKSKARNNLTSGNAVGIPNSFLYITLTNIFFLGGGKLGKIWGPVPRGPNVVPPLH